MKSKLKYYILGSVAALIFLAITGFFLSIDKIADCEKQTFKNGYRWSCNPGIPLWNITRKIHEKKCVSEGGQWSRGAFAPFTYSCSFVSDFEDAGKTCKNSSECGGDCEISLDDAGTMGFIPSSNDKFSYTETFNCKNECRGCCSARKLDKICDTWLEVEDNKIIYRNNKSTICDY